MNGERDHQSVPPQGPEAATTRLLSELNVISGMPDIVLLRHCVAVGGRSVGGQSGGLASTGQFRSAYR